MTQRSLVACCCIGGRVGGVDLVRKLPTPSISAGWLLVFWRGWEDGVNTIYDFAYAVRQM